MTFAAEANGKKVLTMAEYIERGAAIKFLLNDSLEQVGYSREDAADCIRYMDAADVAPVWHGRWVTPHWHNSDYCYNCSECGGEAMHREYQWARNGIYPICPNCGAKMDGGAD